MEQDSGHHQPHTQKRVRVILSCAPCRTSKLKCDRGQPCAQCVKRGLVESCHYAPRPERRKQAKGMAARLKRLEGMVRNMMDSEGRPASPGRDPGEGEVPQMKGKFVQSDHASTYVGGTHFMAVLEDIGDLKEYFEENENDMDEYEDDDQGPQADILFSTNKPPRNHQDLLSRLPSQPIADKLISRYFSCMFPSQNIIHRPTFTQQYYRFWQAPDDAPLHWIAQLFLMLALGVHFMKFSAPHELAQDSLLTPVERIKDFKSCAAWALVRGKFIQPTSATLPGFMLYTESDFLMSRASQMHCYVLSAVNMRLLLKMGLHRDPDRLTGISPFQAEMRRRIWNMGVQIELIVSFHMGLPSIVSGVESDTKVPRNLRDEDFDENSEELPPERPSTEHTPMTYPIHKTKILRVFGRIARQAHALSPPTYEQVLTLDQMLEKVWGEVPEFMKIKPLKECIGETSDLLIQRFGIGALYCKARCVLHRRYLADPVPKPEHDYSRKRCLESAIALLDYQVVIWDACKPGHILSDRGWYVSSLVIHDYLLAAMIVYIVVRDDHIWETGDEADAPAWIRQQRGSPTQDDLKQLLVRSQHIWADVAIGSPELRVTAATLATMLSKIGCSREAAPVAPRQGSTTTSGTSDGSPVQTSSGDPSTNVGSSDGLLNSGTSELSITQPTGPSWDSIDSNGFSNSNENRAVDAGITMNPLELGDAAPSFSDNMEYDRSWMIPDTNVDWRFLDISLAQSHTAGPGNGSVNTFMERMPIDDVVAATGGINDWALQAMNMGQGF
jgi:hypothetical protein